MVDNLHTNISSFVHLKFLEPLWHFLIATKAQSTKKIHRRLWQISAMFWSLPLKINPVKHHREKALLIFSHNISGGNIIIPAEYIGMVC
jgi:hypothetical protein